MSLIDKTRRFQATDAEAVIALFELGNQSYREGVDRTAFDAYMRRARTAEVDRLEHREAEVGARFWVVERDRTVIALFGLEPVDSETLELRRLYVTPRLSGSGLGAAVLAQAEMAACRMGARQLTLTTSAYQKRAIRLYQRSGFAMCTDKGACNPLRGIPDSAACWAGHKVLAPTHNSNRNFMKEPRHA